MACAIFAAGRVGTGEEHAVDRLGQQRRTDGAGADQHLEDFLRHARKMQQLADFQAGECRELRRLVQHRVARDQRRHEHIGTDEVRIVPGRDVGDDTERLVRDELAHPAVVEHLARRQRALRLTQKEVDAPEQAVDLIARLPDRLAHFGGEEAGEPLEVAHQLAAKATDRLDARRRAVAPPMRLRRAGALVGRCNGLGGVVGQFGNDAAVRGIDDGQHAEVVSRRAARVAARKSVSSGSPDSSDVLFQS